MTTLRFIGKDPESEEGGSPTLQLDDANGDVLIQGLKLDKATLAAWSATTRIPDHEVVLRLPARMVPLLRKACDASEAHTG